MPAPAGWYDDGSERQRWWDGVQWTDDFADSAPAEETSLSGRADNGGESATDETAVVVAAEAGTPYSARPKSKRRVPLLALILTGAGALVLGLLVGTASAGAASNSTQLQKKISQQSNEIGELKKTVADGHAQTEKIAQDKAALDKRGADLDKRSQDLTTQEKQVGANTIPGDGVYLVGKDIQPGTYRNEASAGCYWARLSGTTGSFEESLANDNVSGQALVTITGTDVAFKSSRCGKWTLVQ